MRFILAALLLFPACMPDAAETVPLPGLGWESIGIPGWGGFRLEVPGGWLVIARGSDSVAVTFVPDADKEWKQR